MMKHRAGGRNHKVKVAINELENKVIIQEINQTKSWFLEKSGKAVSGENDQV